MQCLCNDCQHAIALSHPYHSTSKQHLSLLLCLTMWTCCNQVLTIWRHACMHASLNAVTLIFMHFTWKTTLHAYKCFPHNSLLSMLGCTNLSTRAIVSKLHGQELAISEPLPTSKLLDHAAVTKCNNDLLGLGLHPASEKAYSLLQAQPPTFQA